MPKRTFADIVLEHLERSEAFTLDPATKNPVIRIAREVDAEGAKKTWQEGLASLHSSIKLYKLSGSERRALEADLEKNYR